ncbi:hypothetical protein FSARC_5453 [Fusarium sarcochroum]|uniref:Zn(2)-C6 fungal-type domain-containing protein n=1 Tax=Fusarium sarcochroum TaxID=1208366 RepID=A0A8H4XA65_9HYPO|nr:hypothetical protein FSARC_5453 [Fusarium sarcochroum]
MLLFARTAPPRAPKRRSRAGPKLIPALQKKKCDETRPSCQRCLESDQECVFEPIRPRRRREKASFSFPDSTIPIVPLPNGVATGYQQEETRDWGVKQGHISGTAVNHAEPFPAVCPLQNTHLTHSCLETGYPFAIWSTPPEDGYRCLVGDYQANHASVQEAHGEVVESAINNESEFDETMLQALIDVLGYDTDAMTFNPWSQPSSFDLGPMSTGNSSSFSQAA